MGYLRSKKYGKIINVDTEPVQLEELNASMKLSNGLLKPKETLKKRCKSRDHKWERLEYVVTRFGAASHEKCSKCDRERYV